MVALVTGFVGPASVALRYALGSRELAKTSNWISNQIFGRAQSWADTRPGRTLQLLGATTPLAQDAFDVVAPTDAWDASCRSGWRWTPAWRCTSGCAGCSCGSTIRRPVLDRALLLRAAPPPLAHLSPGPRRYRCFQRVPGQARRRRALVLAAVASAPRSSSAPPR